MKIPEIERDLRDCDPRVRHWIARLAEEHIALENRLLEAAKVIAVLVDAFENLKSVNLQLSARWEKRLRGESDPGMVESVLNEPEREH